MHIFGFASSSLCLSGKNFSCSCSTGMLPPGVDLSHLQGISAPILGQPFYPLPTASHHILNPRSGTPLQLAMMQQQLQRSGRLRQTGGVRVLEGYWGVEYCASRKLLHLSYSWSLALCGSQVVWATAGCCARAKSKWSVWFQNMCCYWQIWFLQHVCRLSAFLGHRPPTFSREMLFDPGLPFKPVWHRIRNWQCQAIYGSTNENKLVVPGLPGAHRMNKSHIQLTCLIRW